MKTTTSVTARSLVAMAEKNPMGFTIDTNGIEVTKFYTRYVIGLELTLNSHNLEGAEHCIAVMNEILETTDYDKSVLGFGGWLDTSTNLYHFDVVYFTTDFNEAMHLGKVNKQASIFDLETMSEIVMMDRTIREF